MTTTATQIREARQKAGLTIAALAERIGVAPRTIMRWEGADSLPDAQNLAGLARALGLSPLDLIGEPATDPTPDPAAAA